MLMITEAERDTIDLMCRKRRARLEIKEPKDTAYSTLKVLDLGDNNIDVASTRQKLRQIWHRWYYLYPEGTTWRITYDEF